MEVDRDSERMTVVCHIGVGSNVGNREGFCRRAVEELSTAPGVELDRVSSLYETDPLGGPPQRSYVNGVARIHTHLDPRSVLRLCKAIEERLGREPSLIPRGPRVVDLDVLTYGHEKVSEPDLEIPHPRMRQRRFVLVPLLEIDPDAVDPWGKPFADWIDEAEGKVRLL